MSCDKCHYYGAARTGRLAAEEMDRTAMTQHRSPGRRTLIGALAALSASPARAQWPDRTLRLVVAYPAGGGTDIMARAVGARLGELLGQGVAIDNRTGGAGTIGTLAVAQARADGYTALFGNGGEFALRPLLEQNLPYDVGRDFDLVAMCGITPIVLAVNPSLPVTSLAEFIALAKARPGQINVGNTGMRSVMHLAASYLGIRAGIEVSHVPYRGAAPSVADAAAGTIEAVVSGLPPVLAQAREGRLRILAVMTPRRSTAIPDIPTMQEQGFPGVDLSNSVGVAVPRGTPSAVGARLSEALLQAMGDATVRRIFIDNGAEPLALNAAGYAAFLAAERGRMQDLVRVTGTSIE